MSTHGVYYSGFVFLNETDTDLIPTNRIILSHEINRDTKDWWKNARDFSARRDADNLLIPYKIICPSAVQAMVSTQQNLYIFCQDIRNKQNTKNTTTSSWKQASRKEPMCSSRKLRVLLLCRQTHKDTMIYVRNLRSTDRRHFRHTIRNPKMDR